MSLDRRALLSSATAAALSMAGRGARAASTTFRLGVLTDLSGPYQDASGPGSVAAARLAAAEAAAFGVQAEIVAGDHQNKPDIGAGIARQWFDQDGVDAILDVPNSGVALAVASVAREKNKVFLASGAATSDLTGKQCNANIVHWTFDTWMLGRAIGGALVAQGGDSWFFITADYALGHALQRDTTGIVTGSGGTVAGGIAYPFPGTSDFSALLLQAQASGAKVIALCNAGADAVNAIKQAREFGITQRLAGMLMFITDIHAMGLETAKGLVVTETFYWDLNDRTRAFSRRLSGTWKARATMEQAGSYAAALHYLKTAARGGAADMKADGAGAVARMKAMPTDDDCFGAGSIRADGRKLHPSYLFEVKAPAASTDPWDVYRLLATIPADQAFRPIDAGLCALIKT